MENRPGQAAAASIFEHRFAGIDTPRRRLRRTSQHRAARRAECCPPSRCAWPRACCAERRSCGEKRLKSSHWPRPGAGIRKPMVELAFDKRGL